MNRYRIDTPDAGFTLVELLLAVTIMGVILAMLAGSFSAVAHGRVHAENRLAADQAGRSIIWLLSREIRGAVGVAPDQRMPPNRDVLMVGVGHTQSRAPIDSLTLYTFGAGHHRALFGLGAEDLVSYSAEPNPDHRGWFLLMRSQQSGLLPPGAGPQTQPMVLADNVLALHLRYFDGQIWNESWDSRAQQINPLPFAVSIELVMASPGGSPMTFATQVVVPMAVPHG